MAKVFKMPENLDIDYKFIGGKYGMKDIAVRLIGVPLAIPFTLLVYATTDSKLWAFIVFLIPTIIGVYYGSRTVYDGALPLLKAIQLRSKHKNKSTTLYNTRLNGGVEIEREDKTKKEIYNYDYEIAEIEEKLYQEEESSKQ